MTKTRHRKAFILIIVILLFTGFGAWSQYKDQEVALEVTNFEECVQAGNPVMESYPRQCRAGDELFVEEIDESVFEVDPSL